MEKHSVSFFQFLESNRRSYRSITDLSAPSFFWPSLDGLFYLIKFQLQSFSLYNIGTLYLNKFFFLISSTWSWSDKSPLLSVNYSTWEFNPSLLFWGPKSFELFINSFSKSQDWPKIWTLYLLVHVLVDYVTLLLPNHLAR